MRTERLDPGEQIRSLFITRGELDRRRAWEISRRDPGLIRQYECYLINQLYSEGEALDYCRVGGDVFEHVMRYDHERGFYAALIRLGDFEIDYDLSLESKIQRAGFRLHDMENLLDGHITSDNFPVRLSGKHTMSLAILESYRTRPHEVGFAKLIEECSCREGDLAQGLEVVTRYPNLPRRIRFLILGSGRVYEDYAPEFRYGNTQTSRWLTLKELRVGPSSALVVC